MNNYKQKNSLPCQTMEYSPTKWKVGHSGPSCKLICNRPNSRPIWIKNFISTEDMVCFCWPVNNKVMSSLWALYALTSSPIMRAWPKPKGHQASNNGFTYWLYPRVQLSGFWKISPYVFIRYGQNIWRRWRVWRLGKLEKQKHGGERLKNSWNSEEVMSSGLS